MRSALAIVTAVVALAVTACVSPPPAGAPRPLTGTTFVEGRYVLNHKVNGVVVCSYYITVEVSLAAVAPYGEARALTWATVDGTAPDCTFANWSVSAQDECLPTCGKVYLNIGHLEQKLSTLRFTRKPDYASLRFTFTGRFIPGGLPAATNYDDSPQIRCETTSLRCLFQTPSPN